MNAEAEPAGAHNADSAPQKSVAEQDCDDEKDSDSAPPEKASSAELRARFYWALSRL